jgi:hypothetical protein
VEKTALPDHLIRSVSGQTAFEEKLPRVRQHLSLNTLSAMINAIITNSYSLAPLL